MIQPGIGLLFDDTNANIPANWSEMTAYAGRYPLGAAAGANGGTNGGQATHTHDLASHTHNFSASATSARVNVALSIAVRGHASLSHTHSSKASAASSAASGTASNDPPYYEFIIITPTSTAQDVPAGVIGLFDTSLPIDWSNYSSVNNKWPKGVTSGGDAGGTGGSLDAHTHNTDHTHATTTSSTGFPGQQGPKPGAPNSSIAIQNHTHQVTFGTSSANAANADGLPPFRTLIPATSASDGTPLNIIGLWDGTVANIPAGWERVTNMDDKFPKLTASAGTTGGADQHTHSASSSHTHTGTGSSASSSVLADRNFGVLAGMGAGHTHNTVGWTVSSTSAGLQNNTSKSNYPLYRTTIFIKLVSLEAFTPQVIMY